MQRIIGIILILAGTTYYGFFLSFKQTTRLQRLKNFYNSLSVLEGQINFSYTSIPESFKKIASKSSDLYIKQFYSYVSEILRAKTCIDFNDAWNNGISKYIDEVYLKDSDCCILRQVGQMPVYLDKEMQIAHLKEIQLDLKKEIEDIQLHIKEKCKLYKCTGFVAGVFIVLILI